MDSREQEVGKIKYLVNKLRYITLAVQIMPFVYSGLYIIAMVLYLFVSENARYFLDTLLYVSPVIVLGFLFLSRILQLCKWHKSACVLPIFPQILVFIDQYIIDLTKIESYISIATPIAMGVLLLFAAYNIFMK
jgi:hypothetical protein